MAQQKQKHIRNHLVSPGHMPVIPALNGCRLPGLHREMLLYTYTNNSDAHLCL